MWTLPFRPSVYSGARRPELKTHISLIFWQLFKTCDNADVTVSRKFAEINPCLEQFLVLLLFSSFFSFLQRI